MKYIQPILSFAFFLVSCANSPNEQQAPGQQLNEQQAPVQQTNMQQANGETNNTDYQKTNEMYDAETPTNPAQVKLVRMNEQVENAYSIEVPENWANSVFTHRVYEIVKPVTTCSSPDKTTLLFVGDARMPMYICPTDVWGNTSALPSQNPLYLVGNPQSAQQYFANYVQEKFGNNANFKITKTEANPYYAQLSTQRAANFGHNITSDAVKITLTYQADGKTYEAIINGYIGYLNGKMWIPSVSGILCSASNALAYENILFQIDKSGVENPDWKRKQQQRHQAIMQKLQQDHANQLASYNASNQAHAIRMQNMQSAADTRNQNWANQQASLDKNHEQFINYIRGEHTVANSSGQTFKVDNSHQKYFVNTQNNSYIGTDAYTTLNDLGNVAGVNPNDYQEVKIIR